MGFTTDALFSMLTPLWQSVIAVIVALAVAVASTKLVRRGRSRMRTALLVVGGAVVLLVTFSALTAHI